MATKLKGRAPEEVKPGHIKGVLFGGPGAGKSWLALSFPSAFYIDTEGGSELAHYQRRLKDSGGAYFGPEDGSVDFAEIIGQVDALATEQHHFKTLVIDSLSKPFGALLAREQERLGDKDAFGASKKKPVQMVRRLISHLERLDMNVWLICHEIGEWQGTDGERKEVGRAPDTGWDRVAYELDLTLQVKKIGKGIREAVVWKSRLTGFPEFDRFYLQDGGKDVAYANFTERYSKDYIEAESKPIVLATPEQVAEIDRLFQVVRVPQEDIDKILSKHNLEGFNEATTEQAAATIEWLNKKLAQGAKKAS
jgi:hypothetical protein